MRGVLRGERLFGVCDLDLGGVGGEGLAYAHALRVVGGELPAKLAVAEFLVGAYYLGRAESPAVFYKKAAGVVLFGGTAALYAHAREGDVEEIRLKRDGLSILYKGNVISLFYFHIEPQLNYLSDDNSQSSTVMPSNTHGVAP